MQNRHLDIQIQCLIFYLLTTFPKIFITYFSTPTTFPANRIASANPSLIWFPIGTQNHFALLIGCQLGIIYPLFFCPLLSHCKSKIQHILRDFLFLLLFGYLRFNSSLFCTLKNSFVGKIIGYALQHNLCDLICKLLNLVP